MWSAATHLIQEHPLLGVGLGNYSTAIKPTASYRDPIYAHNLFLDIAAETGILNALVFLILLFVSWWHLTRQTQTPRPTKNLLWWASLSLIIFGTHALVETPLYSVHILPLLIALLAL
jgi:O-antigen ligase